MIGHHHTGDCGRRSRSLDRERNAGHPHESARRMRRPPRGAARTLGRNRLIASTTKAKHRKGHHAVRHVGPCADRTQSGMLHFCDLVLLMLILDCTVILVTPTYRDPSHTADPIARIALFRAQPFARNYGDGSQTDGLYTHLGSGGTPLARRRIPPCSAFSTRFGWSAACLRTPWRPIGPT